MLTATNAPDVTTYEDRALVVHFDDACELACDMRAAQMLTTDIDARVDAILAELIRRNLA